MTHTFQGAEAYRRTAVQSASPLQLVVMLYDGALRFLTQAREASAANDRRARAEAISKTLAIVAECQSTLNMERGGNIAAELDRLYSYMTERLLDVSMKQDETAINEVHRLMSTLRDAWSQAAIQEPHAVGAR